jgi:hypothetical protein
MTTSRFGSKSLRIFSTLLTVSLSKMEFTYLLLWLIILIKYTTYVKIA